MLIEETGWAGKCGSNFHQPTILTALHDFEIAFFFFLGVGFLHHQDVINAGFDMFLLICIDTYSTINIWLLVKLIFDWLYFSVVFIRAYIRSAVFIWEKRPSNRSLCVKTTESIYRAPDYSHCLHYCTHKNYMEYYLINLPAFPPLHATVHITLAAGFHFTLSQFVIDILDT